MQKSSLLKILLLSSLLLSICTARAQEKRFKEFDGVGLGISDHRPPYMYYPLNVYYRITKKLDTITFSEPGFSYDEKQTKQKLTDLFGGNPIELKMTVKPTGEIVSVTLVENSGSKDLSDQAIEFVKDAGPYCPGNWFKTEKSFSIRFPALHVTEVPN